MADKLFLAASVFAIAAMLQPAQAQEAMTVVRDAETGKLRAPSAAEVRAIQGTSRARSPGTPTARPQSVMRPDGTRVIDLGERGLVYSVSTRGPDGKLVKKCIKGEHAQDAIEKKGETIHDHQ